MKGFHPYHPVRKMSHHAGILCSAWILQPPTVSARRMKLWGPYFRELESHLIGLGTWVFAMVGP